MSTITLLQLIVALCVGANEPQKCHTFYTECVMYWQAEGRYTDDMNLKLCVAGIHSDLEVEKLNRIEGNW